MAEIEIFRARNTTGLAINGERVTATKPYGLIQTTQRFEVDDKEILKAIGKAADVQPVIETEDLATATEQFICKNCGIRVENFDKIILEEDNDGYINKLFYEYIFKFCPECGAKVKDGDTE